MSHKRVQISIPPDVLELVDITAEKRGESRSKVISEIVMTYFDAGENIEPEDWEARMADEKEEIYRMAMRAVKEMQGKGEI